MSKKENCLSKIYVLDKRIVKAVKKSSLILKLI